MTDELKACPFCGGLAVLDWDDHGNKFVVCKACSATGSYFEDRDAARHAWNTRGNTFDRSPETSRRQSAVELLLSIGYVWSDGKWNSRPKASEEGAEMSLERVAVGLDNLAKVIRQYGTCAPAALEKLAKDIRAHIAHDALNPSDSGAVAWRVVANKEIWDLLNDDERDVLYFDKNEVPTGTDALGFTITPLYTTPRAPAEDVRDAARYEYLLDCEVTAAREHLPGLDAEAFKAARRARHDDAMADKGEGVS